MNWKQHHFLCLQLLQGKQAGEAAALYHDLHTHLAQNYKKLEEAPHIIKRRLQMGEYKCEMPQCMVLYTNLLSIKNMAAASFLPSKFIQILFVANMNLEPYSTGNYETFSSWLGDTIINHFNYVMLKVFKLTS